MAGMIKIISICKLLTTKRAAAFLSFLTKFSVNKGIPTPAIAVATAIKIIVTLPGFVEK